MPRSPRLVRHPIFEAAYGKEGEGPLEVHQGAPVSRAIASTIIRSGMSLPAKNGADPFIGGCQYRGQKLEFFRVMGRSTSRVIGL
jgi:hypothetical protein